MKKKLLLATILSLVSIQANAAATGTLILSGTVAAACNITVTPNGSNNTTLDIVAGETNKNVASVNESCNNATGYKINIKSDNGGELRHTGNASLKTTYTIVYDGQTITPTTNFQQAKNVSVLNSPSNYNAPVLVNVAAYANALAGTYTDTVTMQIVANP